MSDIQGFLVELTLDGNIIDVYCNDVALARAKNVMAKATMDGTGVPTQLVGLSTGTLSMNGQVDTAGQTVLEATWAKDTKVAFILVVGDGGTIDAGTYEGFLALSTFDVEAAADGLWNFSLSGDTDTVSFAPPA